MILERYLFREIGRTVVAVLFLLILTFLSMRFVQYLADAAAGKISGALIFSMLGLRILTAMVVMLPLCLYLAVYLTLSRMDRDNEMLALHAFGLGANFLVGRVTKMGLLFAILVAALSFYVSPWAETRLMEMEAQAKLESDITGIGSGRFKEFSDGDRVIYVERIADDKATMNNIFVQVREKDQLSVMTSASARVNREGKGGERYLVFTDGSRYTGKPGDPDFSVTEYEAYGVRIDAHEEGNKTGSPQASAMADLIRNSDLRYMAELQWRLSMPVTAVLLALIATTLVKVTSQRARYTGLATAVIVYFVYSNLLAVARSYVKHGQLPIFPGLAWVHLAALLVLLALYFYPQLLRRRRQRAAP